MGNVRGYLGLERQVSKGDRMESYEKIRGISLMERGVKRKAGVNVGGIWEVSGWGIIGFARVRSRDFTD